VVRDNRVVSVFGNVARSASPRPSGAPTAAAARQTKAACARSSIGRTCGGATDTAAIGPIFDGGQRRLAHAAVDTTRRRREGLAAAALSDRAVG
jgi:hypothetical protein